MVENLFKSSRAQRFNVIAFLFFSVLELLNPLNVERASAQTPFYQGKTVTVVVGSAPGGLYDIWGRLLARTMGKYIPGNPTMLVQNMPGGGSMIAANYLYGTLKGWLHSALPDPYVIGAMVGRPQVNRRAQVQLLGSQEKAR